MISSIIYRNIDDEDMLCNLMYNLSIKPDEENRKYVPTSGLITVTLNVDNPKDKLTVSDVNGEIHIPGLDNSKKMARVEDILLKEQTLYDDEYYLDNGKFDAFPPLLP